MEWLSPENVVAVLTALLGVLASGAVLWYERRVPRRKRIGYRVQLDTPIGSNAPGGGRGNVRLGLFNETPDMSDATLVLLRIENDGAQSIAGDDYTGRGVHGLTAEFADRTVRAIAVTQPADADHLMEHFTPAAGLRHTDGTIHLPRVPLNRGEHYKLLVLLTGGHVGSPIGVTGGIRDGEVRPNRSTTPDDKPPVFSRAARTITVLLTACVIVLASIIVVREDAPPPMGCQRGSLTLTGSTAFAPVVRELAAKYEKDCEGATVVVDAHGSTAGIRALADEGAEEDKAPALVALSDGPKPGGYPQLREVRVAVSLFTLVVNDRVPVRDLSLTDVRRIYAGEITNWKQLGGPDLAVLLVSRDANSGTREVFQRRVLHRNEPANSSRDCAHRDDPQAPVVRCELDSTEQVLATVARLPGAIGYSELRSGSGLKGAHRLSIGGQAPNVDEIGRSAYVYPYLEIEYAYTYGQPPADSLASSFLGYLTRGSGQDVIRTHGHLPCGTPKGLRICGED
ncbi:substrate-binding domain-containing protein [Streptomyces sp. AM8-1-1]|uniref:substrate-binding domain-containing protein n=1 Tax=Streptomyces sp. AM8-1-1 TaxID=3075825 RepID=UPI0028C448C0|nr:substrate-binding domain-containing protein [Streptomyces sp. AM8-1-1]WNO73308.1 substrate-binding domain-containing protein [Streptomyces sp. AM8-1-1]